VCALQAADLLAREAFKHLDNVGIRPTRKPVEKLREQLYFIPWNAEGLNHLAANGGPENLDLLANWDFSDAPRLGHVQI
jgi:hypothetical protein